ncbi:Oidioi.mRNA.OKI2018_I69.PAR.g9556.t1.cds [Oikopleura dioica]|uniref:Oidioi.mRNA.OKI2018_I69.PAR.g9556.t1.cds n=1 Tax=Oikopleura dioica TaxID=34765 RepID=A0ABN7RRP2_OIKDI|nr:Oidioi.mRNA.OKI2018_I69.PAR.g9556.t1.cds [Oikopleura dioica]
MKLSILALSASASSVGRVRRQIDQGPRRYSQLMDQMTAYNENFDERDYWTYGCHCFFLGDRPMTQMGKGAPVDALDSVCKQYKECLKCAREEFGEMCIGEFVSYGLKLKNGPTCTDSAGTCGRSLCECDKRFAQQHVEATPVFNQNYHQFWTKTGFDVDENCVPSGNGPSEPQCCGKSDSFSVIYNSLNKQCCDGSVKTIGSC